MMAPLLVPRAGVREKPSSRTKRKLIPQTGQFWTVSSETASMKERARESPSCAICHGTKHACEKRTPTGRCDSCSRSIVKGDNDDPWAIRSSPDYPEEAIKKQFQTHGWREGALELEAFHTDISIHDSEASPPSFIMAPTVPDPSSSTNYPQPSVGASLQSCFNDLMREHFSVDLNGKADETGIIGHASLAGARLAHIMSTFDVQRSVALHIDGQMISELHQKVAYALQFRLLSMGSLSLLVKEVLDAIRPEGMEGRNPYGRRLAYSAAAILYKEIKFFAGKRKKKGVSVQLPHGVEGPFMTWILSGVQDELHQRLREACGRYPPWRSVIQGNVQQLLRRRVETSFVTTYSLRRSSSSQSSEHILSTTHLDDQSGNIDPSLKSVLERDNNIDENQLSGLAPTTIARSHILSDLSPNFEHCNFASIDQQAGSIFTQSSKSPGLPSQTTQFADGDFLQGHYLSTQNYSYHSYDTESSPGSQQGFPTTPIHHDGPFAPNFENSESNRDVAAAPIYRDHNLDGLDFSYFDFPNSELLDFDGKGFGLDQFMNYSPDANDPTLEDLPKPPDSPIGTLHTRL